MQVTGLRTITKDWNVFLHEYRSTHLQSMPANINVLLSAGCSGRWYFDWITENYGQVEQHIGIEYYLPKPDDLPVNVKWINNNVSDMSGVTDESVDLVYSGQNIEHLWPNDVIAFISEAWRVLRPEGHLVIDSPNREITAALNWSNPEHTVEFTVDEALELCALGGFEVRSMKGLWLCKDPKTGKNLKQWGHRSIDRLIKKRMLGAADNPEKSFIWWMEAKKTSQPPQRKKLQKHMNQVFKKAWPERVQRLRLKEGTKIVEGGDGIWINVDKKAKGVIFDGPNMPLWTGSHIVSFRLRFNDRLPASTEPVARVEVVCLSRDDPIARVDVYPTDGEHKVELSFELDQLEFGLQFCLVSYGRAPFQARFAIDLDSGPFEDILA